MARAPVSKTGGWGFESLHSCQVGANVLIRRWKNSVGTTIAVG
jgi:hypothetical protein